MLRFIQVSKRYGNGHQALSNVSFTLDQGEMAFVTGHSGAGKSTLLRLAALVEPVSSGSVVVQGKNLQRIPKRQLPYLKRSLGLVFQNPQLLEDRSVYDNVALPLIVSGQASRDIPRRVRAALDKVNLLPKERVSPLALSMGEQQRVSIARAIVHRPELVLADEPTGNLDPELSGEIMKLFHDLNQVGVSLLIASHDVALISTMHHRTLRLANGCLLEDSQAVAA